MAKPYSQSRAMLAITRASLHAIFRSTSAVNFTFLFPLIFIHVFGLIGGGGRINLRITFDEKADTANMLYRVIRDSTVGNNS
jgi:ABC-2 type transport system permease protein